MTTMRDELGREWCVEFEKDCRLFATKFLIEKGVQECDREELLENYIHDLLDKEIPEEELIRMDENLDRMNEEALVICESMEHE